MFSDGVAAEVIKILKANVSVAPVQGQIQATGRGKTGTTDDFGDAWFAGIGKASTVVWVGYQNAKIPMTAVHGIRVAGGTLPATIWGIFMRAAYAGNPPPDWGLPSQPAVWESFNGQYQYRSAPPSQGGGDKNDKPTSTGASPPPPPPSPSDSDGDAFRTVPTTVRRCRTRIRLTATPTASATPATA